MSSSYKPTDIHQLLEESKTDPKVITIEATVITGFEFQAVDECKEKCKPLAVCKSKGRIFFNIPIENYQNVFTLKSVDNLFLVGESVKKVTFEGNKEKDLETIKALVTVVDWKHFIPTWAELVSFKGILFPERVEKPEIHDVVLSESSFTKIGGGDSKVEKTEENGSLLVNKCGIDDTLNDVKDISLQDTIASVPSLILDDVKEKLPVIGNERSCIDSKIELPVDEIKNGDQTISNLGQGDVQVIDKPAISLNSNEKMSAILNKQSANKHIFKDTNNQMPNNTIDETEVLDHKISNCNPTATTNLISGCVVSPVPSPSEIALTIDRIIEDIAGLSSAEERASQLMEVTVLDKEKDDLKIFVDKDIKTIAENVFNEKIKDEDKGETLKHKEDSLDRKNDVNIKEKVSDKEKRNRSRQGGKNFGKKRWANKKKEPGVGAKPYVDDGILKYRVTCYRTGTNHSFTSMNAASDFGGRLQDEFGWTVDLTRFDLNVFLIIGQDSCYITSALTKESFHRRNISHFGRTTLRATMCYNLIRLAEPVKGEIVMDPLCGGGSIPIEGSISFPYTFHICGDIDEKSVVRTQGNLNHLTKAKGLQVDAIRWDALNIPLKDQCVDIFVTDLPFGKRSGDKKDNFNLYKNLLYKLARVVKVGSGRASLLSYDRKALIQAIWSSDYWKQIRNINVNQGGLNSSVFLLLRTSKVVE